MSGTYPISPAPEDVETISDLPTLISVADSGKRQARNAGGHLWEFAYNYGMLTDDDFNPIEAFVMAQDGGLEEFQVIPPHKEIPNGTALGSPQVATSIVGGATSVPTSGWTPNQPVALKSGDVFKFDNHSKVYILVEDLIVDGAGAGTINFRPELIVNVALGIGITKTSVPFTVYIPKINKYKTESPIIHSYTVRMLESL